MQTIGPIRIIGEELNTEVKVPLATFETPMWPSTNRGASVSRRVEGIRCTVIDERMTRSVLLEAPNALIAKKISDQLQTQHAIIQRVIQTTSNHIKLLDINTQIVGNLLYIRLEASTGDASGHNMTTKAADAFIQWTLAEHKELKYISISGNYCTDKKVSAVNGLLGRGKNVIAEIEIPTDVCQERLKTTPAAIVNLHIKKNLMGSIVTGGLRTANAHFANLLLAFYLATGQDAANIVEGSQGFVHTEVRDNGSLYFSVTIPNIIVGTVGNGKHLDFVQENLRMLGCDQPAKEGQNARRLAIITAATVLCGELSLLAAQTNPGELMKAHTAFERGQATYRETNNNPVTS